MPDEKITDMSAATALAGTELVEVVQGGNNVKATADQFKTFMHPVADSVSLVTFGTDKAMRIDVGAVADSTVRVLIMPDADVDLAEVALNTAHTVGDGSDHSDVALNTSHAVGDGSDHADVGTNTTHRGLTNDPHNVTKTQVGLGSVTDDAQLKRAANDFDGFGNKATPVAGDRFLIEDSADTFTKKYVLFSTLGGGGHPVADSTSLVSFGTDKEMRIDVGAVADSTVRVLTMPDADVDLGVLMVGPASATDTAITIYDGTTGKLTKNTGLLISATDRLIIAAGTELLPSVTFPSDPNTGPYALAADAYGISLGGNLGMGLNLNNGTARMGIGVAPQTDFHFRSSLGGVIWRADPKEAVNARNYAIIFGSLLDGDMVIKQATAQGQETNPGIGNIRMVFNPSGNIGIGVSTVLGQLHVKTSITGAIPVLQLDQSDLSEEIIRFQATEGTGNPIEVVGAKSLTTTKFIRVKANNDVLYIPVGTIA